MQHIGLNFVVRYGILLLYRLRAPSNMRVFIAQKLKGKHGVGFYAPMTIASRVKEFPRIASIRSEEQMVARVAKMSSLEIWYAMFTPRIQGWKHKILSDEFERRRSKTRSLLGLNGFMN